MTAVELRGTDRRDEGETVGAAELDAFPDLDAFSDFVRDRGGSLRRAAFLLTRDWYRADDLVQTALVHTFERRHRIRNFEALESYTRKVITTTFLSGRRRKSAGEVPLRAVTDERQPDRIAGITDTLAMWDALGALTDMQRAVLVLRYYGDASEAEIAAALGCRPGTVKAHASRGIAALRKVLGQDAEVAALSKETSEPMPPADSPPPAGLRSENLEPRNS